MKQEKMTFDQLPEAVTILAKEVSELKRLFIERQEQPPTNPPEELLTVQQAAEFLNLAVPTVYSKVHRRELPVMKRGKRLYFSRTELLDYLKAGRKQTIAEIEQEADTYLLNKKKGLNHGK